MIVLNSLFDGWEICLAGESVESIVFATPLVPSTNAPKEALLPLSEVANLLGSGL
ncbi:hypothetical protein LLID5_07010 [Lactococcus lactis]|nr:hypothetical protein LLID5_07010 [Lactococcus lactis]